MAAGDVIVVSEDGSGKKGNLFDGTDDYVLHDAHAVARVAANDTVGTYTAWIYLDNYDTERTICSAGDNNSATEYLTFHVNDGGNLRITLYHGGANQFIVRTNSAEFANLLKQWVHVAVVQDGVQPKLYINGENVAETNQVATDLTMWFDELTGCDKFAIGVKESNATHTNDWSGAIGRVKYFNIVLTADEILRDAKGEDQISPDSDSARAAAIETARVFDISMEDDGITDSGSGADNGTLTGHAHYGGIVSDWSRTIEANVTGHAAEALNTVINGSKFRTVIKRGD